MERFLFTCITFTAFAIVNTQKSNILNPDNIYFDDNRPSAGKSVLTHVLPTTTQLPYNFPNLNSAPVVQNYPSNGQVFNNGNPGRYPQEAEIPVYEDIVSPAKSSQISSRIRLDQTAKALTNFSLNVMKHTVALNQENAVMSPYSVATLLALLQQGSSQLSLQQISAALQMSPDVSAATYKSQTQDISSRSSRNVLRTANNMFVADAFSLNPTFKMVAQRDFDSEVTAASFDRPEVAAQNINGWVAAKTDNKIDKLIFPDALSSHIQMVLVNAIYFKGLWAIPFHPESTKPDAFTLRSGVKKNVPFMKIRRYFRAGTDAQTDSKVVILPFDQDEYSLMVIQPSSTSSAQETLQSLTVTQLERYLNYKSIEVSLKIPKFTIKADTNLTPVLKQMGVTQIFEQNSGLVGVGMYRTFTPQVSSAVHSALLSIDENGAVAAAASAFGLVALSNDAPTIFVNLDRPFLAILWDEKTKVPLFVAKIEDPSL